MNAPSEPLTAGALTIFGPVPSRRLGHSLGIGNVPAKTCSYAHLGEEIEGLREPSSRTVLDRLVADHRLMPVTYRDHLFYLRRFS